MQVILAPTVSLQCSALLAAIEELDACPAAQATDVLRWVSASHPAAARKAAKGILQALLDNARAAEQVTHAQLRSIEAKLSEDVAKIEEGGGTVSPPRQLEAFCESPCWLQACDGIDDIQVSHAPIGSIHELLSLGSEFSSV